MIYTKTLYIWYISIYIYISLLLQYYDIYIYEYTSLYHNSIKYGRHLCIYIYITSNYNATLVVRPVASHRPIHDGLASPQCHCSMASLMVHRACGVWVSHGFPDHIPIFFPEFCRVLFVKTHINTWMNIHDAWTYMNLGEVFDPYDPFTV
jgi:hypothetical protein